MVVRLTTLVFIAAQAWMSARTVPFCLEDQSRWRASDLAQYKQLLISAASSYGWQLEESCRSASPVWITILPESFSADLHVLGATRAEGGRILPEVYLFRFPIRRMLLSDLPFFEIRAMVLVTLHELRHFLEQRCQHDPTGGFSAVFTPAQLFAWSSHIQ
ncbi:MAG: hypothetical protein NZV14_13855 [Bryobacteraceae bacterium]|nr:hypothetical protein [Bryobacteraceae bacterium]MDW8379244.1 hypothetical protein [Bryobacterales bacterium]